MRNYSKDTVELTSENDLKKWTCEYEKIVTNNINVIQQQAFGARSHAYHTGINKYVQIKKYEEGRKVYICKVKEEEAKQKDIEVTHEEITDQIAISARVIAPEVSLTAQIQVGINDKIHSIKDIIPIASSGSLQIVYKNTMIKGEETFFKRGILQGDSFFLFSGTFEGKKWRRFEKVEFSDYFYMNQEYWDAICFKPKNDIYFLGFGLVPNYER